jgi:hypothetical protein
MRIRIALISLTLLLLAPGAAFASLTGEESLGRDLAAQLQSGAKTCRDLSADDLEHIGEYVTGRALGSTGAHEAMNERMRVMIGQQGEVRMHQVMGARYTACAGGSTASGGTVMGPGMMGGYTGKERWGSMMNSGDLSWMIGGTWRTMSRQDWQRLQHQWLGTTATTSSHHGWSPWAIIAAVVGAVFLAGLASAAVARRRLERTPHAPS